MLKYAAGLAIIAAAPSMPDVPIERTPGVVENGGPFRMVDGRLVQAHGGGVIKVGRHYYLLGENRDGYRFRAVSMYRSTDLVTWERRRDILAAATTPALASVNLERPKVIYNPATRKYLLWAHKENGRNYDEARVVVATSDTVDGDYRYLTEFRPLGHESRDMTLFVDDDGRGYLISAARSNYDLNIYRLDAAFTGVEALVAVLKGHHREAPALFKRGETYFLVTSAATGWRPNRAAFQTAPSIAGPWTAPVPFGDARTYNSQSTFVLPVAGRRGTDWLYMGDQWAPAYGMPVNASAYVWLPLRFPTPTSVAMTGSSRITIDAAAGRIALGGGPTIRLRGGANGLCVAVRDGALDFGAPVVEAACGEAADQRLERRTTDGGRVRFVFQHSGLCLARQDGGDVAQRPCGVGAATEWSPDAATLVDPASGQCLHGAGEAGTAVRVRPCGNAPAQRWSPG